MRVGLTDEEIITGLRNRDSEITKTYFYGYCRIAYYIYQQKYELQLKPEMDFYSLAHEYYLSLDKHNFKQLEDRNSSLSLRTWMINGFRFVILDRLKSLEKSQRMESLEERVQQSNLQFDIVDNNFNEIVRQTIEEICDSYYGRDSREAIILKMMLIEGFQGKEVAVQMGMTPSAITQRYHKMMNTVVIPYFKHNFNTPSILYDIRVEDDYNYNEVEAETPSISRRYLGHILFSRNSVKESPKRIAPDHITELQPDEVFVFGSNLIGLHGGGAARMARLYFGAVMGQGEGLQGQSYAIPTMQGGVETIRPYVDKFIKFAKENSKKQFLVTRIGCGIAGFEVEDIAPLFKEALGQKNIYLPKDFVESLQD